MRPTAGRGGRPAEPLTGPGTPEHFAARVRYVGRQRELRNRPDGYWITSADPAAASQAYTGMEDVDGLRSVTLLSDGATRFVDFSLGDWREPLALLGTAGINGGLTRR